MRPLLARLVMWLIMSTDRSDAEPVVVANFLHRSEFCTANCS